MSELDRQRFKSVAQKLLRQHGIIANFAWYGETLVVDVTASSRGKNKLECLPNDMSQQNRDVLKGEVRVILSSGSVALLDSIKDGRTPLHISLLTSRRRALIA